MERAFDFDYYWRRLGLSDVLSWITGALFLIAFFDVTAIYEKEDWLKDSYVGIRIAAFFFMFPLLHVAFKIDHGCPNNYIGRVFHDCFFLIAFSVVVYLYRVILQAGWEIQFNVGVVVSSSVLIFLLAMFYECVVALLKTVMRRVGWQLL